jgi:hypothetical protein
MKPKVVIRSKNKHVAEGTYKAYLRVKNYTNQLKLKYTKEVITFERKNLVPKYEQTYEFYSQSKLVWSS